ncbi:hypothetical protein ACIA5E_21225 [Nocardia asteroides]|uniref:hypothetical protein n=1 Tax=Nocardia asteroides TaxID=1824 RepID=UPI00379481AC
MSITLMSLLLFVITPNGDVGGGIVEDFTIPPDGNRGFGWCPTLPSENLCGRADLVKRDSGDRETIAKYVGSGDI